MNPTPSTPAQGCQPMTDDPFVEAMKVEDAKWGDDPAALRETIVKLRERCQAYKGQVKAGSDEIASLKARIEDLESDCLRLHKNAVDRWEFLKEIEIISDKCVDAEFYGVKDALNDLLAIRSIIKRFALSSQEAGK